MNQQYRQFLLDGQTAGLRYGFVSARMGSIQPCGNQLGRRAGSSLEYMDHREYVPGDDLRQVNWSMFARTDKLAIKLYQNEVYPYLDLVIDCSRSMALDGSTKIQATLGLAGLLCQAAQNSGYMFSAWTAGESLNKVESGHLDPVLWEGIEFSHRQPVPESLEKMQSRFRPSSIRVLISDLLWLGEPLDTIRILAAGASELYIVQVLAKTEIEPDQFGNMQLIDSETEKTLDVFVDNAAVWRYKSNLEKHQQNWSRACRSSGSMFINVCAENIVSGFELGDFIAKGVLRAV